MPAIAQPVAVNSAPIPLIVRGSETKSAPIQWIWPGRIARAKLTLFAGAPSSGKSAGREHHRDRDHRWGLSVPGRAGAARVGATGLPGR
jgi:hypothetical protein